MPLKKFSPILAHEAAVRVSGKERKQWRTNRGSYVATLRKENRFRVEIKKEIPLILSAGKTAAKLFPFTHTPKARNKYDKENSRKADLFVAHHFLLRLASYVPKKQRSRLTHLFHSIVDDCAQLEGGRLIQQRRSLVEPHLPTLSVIPEPVLAESLKRIDDWAILIEKSNLIPHLHQNDGHSIYHGLVEARYLVAQLASLAKK